MSESILREIRIGSILGFDFKARAPASEDVGHPRHKFINKALDHSTNLLITKELTTFCIRGIRIEFLNVQVTYQDIPLQNNAK